ncbi:cassette chromosome ssDNA-binding protein [Staphylococcus haemolyticus]|uniref:cassette chromosome ssDNA-binding protein n=1 Tax=Staphylococcus haemolyticus TaxID=1283 RepID=UPI00069D582F|nr:DUF1413 domain-containing protein [Staphylococcus haemolyticus]PTK86050.1 hypothetical protein BUZ16_01015 [Staphylococcus haemolyticus]PTL02392.1 hypothetical protein BUZ41_08450 [Staphylococcus haemolyticus]PTL16046.1 hypothetical protein BUZ30_03750 [Staphylococcus haemolyticus]
MKKVKSEEQNKCYYFLIAKAFQQSVGSMFTFGELRKNYGVDCSTNDQREIGRRFAYWIKHTPELPFKIVGKKNGSLLYEKTGPNPKHTNRNWKGGSN